jgi:hypothetical protein
MCGREINSLSLTAKKYIYYDVYLSEGRLRYAFAGEDDEIHEEAYCCPKCFTPLFSTQEEVVAFLKGEATK